MGCGFYTALWCSEIGAFDCEGPKSPLPVVADVGASAVTMGALNTTATLYLSGRKWRQCRILRCRQPPARMEPPDTGEDHVRFAVVAERRARRSHHDVARLVPQFHAGTGDRPGHGHGGVAIEQREIASFLARCRLRVNGLAIGGNLVPAHVVLDPDVVSPHELGGDRDGQRVAADGKPERSARRVSR